jgi:MoaA/NifB/PqqE/SkfB family radical SAM enzyme
MTRLPERIKNLFASRARPIAKLPVLVVMPYSGCNCRCMMCDYWRDRPDRETRLSPHDLASQMDSLRALGVDWVILSGGEPLLHPDIREIFRTLGRLDAKISLLTNGLLLGEQAASVVRHCHDVIVSLDGDRETHDRIRGVPGAFERMAEGIRVLKTEARAYRVTGRCVIQKANYARFPGIIDAARDLGLDSISFLAVDVFSPAFNHPGKTGADRRRRLLLDDREVGDFRRLLTETFKSHSEDFHAGFIAESPAKLRRLGDYFAAARGRSTFPAPRCNAPWISAVIDADGSVRPCFFHDAYGGIHDGRIDEVINSARALAFRKGLHVRKNAVCRRCVCSLWMRPGDAGKIRP